MRPAPLRTHLLAVALSGCTLANSFDAALLPGPPTEATPAACAEGEDNDGDGLPDCADPDCGPLTHCQEVGAAACANGQDEDVDGLVDCADPDCHPLFSCLPWAPLPPVADCPPSPPDAGLGEGFRTPEVAEEKWQVFSTYDGDRPRLVALGDGRTGIDPHGTDAWFTSGIASRRRFDLSGGRPFDLRFTLSPRGDCARAPVCQQWISLDLTEDWRDGAAEELPVVGVRIRGRAGSPRALAVECIVNGVSFREDDPVILARADAADHRVAIQSDPESGEVVWSWLAHGEPAREFCRAPPLPRDMPRTAGLVVRSRGTRDADYIAVSDIRLHVGAPPPPAGCEGVRRSLIAVPFCPDPHDSREMEYRVGTLWERQGPWWQSGLWRVKPVRLGPDADPAYLLAVAGSHAHAHADIGSAVRPKPSRAGGSSTPRTPSCSPTSPSAAWATWPWTRPRTNWSSGRPISPTRARCTGRRAVGPPSGPPCRATSA